MVPVPATALLVTSTRGAVPGYWYIKGAAGRRYRHLGAGAGADIGT